MKRYALNLLGVLAYYACTLTLMAWYDLYLWVAVSLTFAAWMVGSILYTAASHFYKRHRRHKEMKE